MAGGETVGIEVSDVVIEDIILPAELRMIQAAPYGTKIVLGLPGRSAEPRSGD